MMSLNPLLLVGGVIGTVSVLLLIAYACVNDKKTAMGFKTLSGIIVSSKALSACIIIMKHTTTCPTMTFDSEMIV